MDVAIFLNFYWLKVELVDFCRCNKLPTGGDKQTLTNRIAVYLRTGSIQKDIAPKNHKQQDTAISLDGIIPKHYKNDQRHRAFFKQEIGERFKFNVSFMKWMTDHAGSTYQEAVEAWYRIEQDRRAGIKQVISPQFEYNQYIRDFFKDQTGYSLKEAIKCWTYKRSLAGANVYEKADLKALE